MNIDRQVAQNRWADARDRSHRYVARIFENPTIREGRAREFVVVSEYGDRATVHHATNRWCDCDAAKNGDLVCLHRAAVHELTGFVPGYRGADTYAAWAIGGVIDDLQNLVRELESDNAND